MTAIEFKNCILPLYGIMKALARHILGDIELSEDVTQEVMKNLWERHNQLNNIEDYKSFCLRCIRNASYDALRRRHLMENITEADFEIILDSDIDDEYIEKLNMLTRYLESFPEQTREIMRMNVQGVDSKEIARLTGVSASNVRQILSRTRKKLREIILNNFTEND